MNLNNSKVVAIHQPNFFPWLGYFDKIYRSDLFVYLDHAKGNTRNPLWTKRVKIIVNNTENWLTIPLTRNHSSVYLPTKEMTISNLNIGRKHLNTIRQSYGKAPFFEKVFPLILAFYESPNHYIANRNIDFIENVCEKLNICTPRILSSNYNWDCNGTDLLVKITRYFKGNAYLCGGGASGYQEDEKFNISGLDLIYQNYNHPAYPQFNNQDFTPGLSIIDTLMNVGFEGTEKLLKIDNSCSY